MSFPFYFLCQKLQTCLPSCWFSSEPVWLCYSIYQLDFHQLMPGISLHLGHQPFLNKKRSTFQKKGELIEFIIILISLKLGQNDGILGMFFDILYFSINNYHFAQISVQVPQIFDELTILPDHCLSAENTSDVHLLRIYLRQLAHNGELIFFCKYDNLVFLGQTSQ